MTFRYYLIYNSDIKIFGGILLMKTKKIVAVLLTFIMWTFLIFPIAGFSACFTEQIEIIDESLSFKNGGSGLALNVKIKNTSYSTIKTSFCANIYKNGEVFDSTISDVITLDAGEVGTVSSITLISRQIYEDYTYKITKWNYYAV